MQMNSNFEEFEILREKGAFDCAGIRAQVFGKAVDRQSKDLATYPSAVESVFFPQKDFKFFKTD